MIAARGGEDLVKRLFEPLGYTVSVERARLDDRFPDWGESPYVSLTVSGTVRLQDLLTHLYLLIPVLDNEKHYCVAQDEIEKLKTTLPRHLHFTEDVKILDLARRGGAESNLAGRQAIEQGIAMGRGAVWLNLTPEQYRKLKTRSPVSEEDA